MAEAFLQPIYQCAEVISILRQVVECLRVEEAHRANLLLEEYEEKIRMTCADCLNADYSEALNLWQLVQHIYCDEPDTIVKADMIENAIIPILEKWIQSVGSIVQPVDEEFQLESTACGFLTLKSLRTGRYLHSNNNPMEEARKQIEYFYVPSVDEYALMGCGLGYQAYQLYRISNGSVKIHIFEQNANVVEIARKYGVLDWIPQNLLKITVKDSLYSFLKAADSNNIGVFMHLPSLRLIRNEKERSAMLQAYGEQHTPVMHRRNFCINFWRNLHSAAKYIDYLKAGVKEETVVVAAGPSLDDDIEILREWQGKKTIIAVGTVLKKLLNQDIKPDYVVVMDPQARTVRQIEGAENANVPMILDACAYWEFASRYQGEKYFVLTPQFDEILQYAKEHHLNVWPSGGTVMSLAVEVAIQFKAKKVYLMGVDLAYPSGLSHASDTMDRRVESMEGMQEVCGVAGTTVYATHVFEIYRKWLENHISRHKDIEWYNLSTKGARIHGTREIGAQVLEGSFETK